jgi:glycosyltransferase involved in cell wall biosynthesis
MALGTPSVSTDVTGIPEVIHDDVTGLMVPQRDPQALADALERLLCDVVLRERLAVRARQLIVGEFDIHRNAAQLRRVIGLERASSASSSPNGVVPDRVAATIGA